MVYYYKIFAKTASTMFKYTAFNKYQTTNPVLAKHGTGFIINNIQT